MAAFMYIILYYFKSIFTDDFCYLPQAPVLHEAPWRDTVVSPFTEKVSKSLAQGAYYKAALLGVGGLLLSFSHCPTDFFLLSGSTPIKESVRPSPEPLSQETKGEGKPLFLVLTSRGK